MKKYLSLAALCIWGASFANAEVMGPLRPRPGTGMEYIWAEDMTINADSYYSAISLEGDSRILIEAGGGDGTLYLNKEGTFSSIQVGTSDSDNASLVIRAHVEIASSSRTYSQTGDIHVSGSSCTIEGNLLISHEFPAGQNPGEVFFGSLLVKGGEMTVSGHIDISGSALSDNTFSDLAPGGVYSAVFAGRGGSEDYESRSLIVLGQDAGKSVRLHDITLESAFNSVEVYGILADNDASKEEYANAQESRVLARGNVLIESLEAVTTEGASSARVAGAEARHNGIVVFEGGLTVRHLSARGSVSEVYSLSAVDGGRVEVNPNRDGSSLVCLEGDLSASGEFEGRKAAIQAAFLNRGSYFEGRTLSGGGGGIDLEFSRGASWYVTGDNHLQGTLTLGESAHVYVGVTREEVLSARSGFPVGAMLTVDRLEGEGGIFHLRSDVGADRTDSLVIGNGQGRHFLDVKSTGQEMDVERMASPLAVLQQGTAGFSLLNDRVEVGLYTYHLEEEEVSGEKRWYLASDSPSLPDDKSSYSSSAQSVLGISTLGVHYTMWMSQMGDLRKRSGEIREGKEKGGLTFRSFLGEYDFDALGGLETSQKIYGYSLGYGYKWESGEGNRWMAGFAAQFTRADQTVRDAMRSQGRNEACGFLGNATWFREDGWYADGTFGMQFYDQDVSSFLMDGDKAKGGYRNTGVGAGLELGRAFRWESGFFLEPRVQLSYFFRDSASYCLSNGMRVKMDSADSLTGQVGLSAGRKFEGRTYTWTPYVTGGLTNEFFGDQTAVVNGSSFESRLEGARLFYGGGLEISLSRNIRFYAQYQWERGDRLEQSWGGSVGAAISF